MNNDVERIKVHVHVQMIWNSLQNYQHKMEESISMITNFRLFNFPNLFNLFVFDNIYIFIL